MKIHNQKKSGRFNAPIVRFGALSILAILAAALLPGLLHNPEVFLAMGMILPIGLGTKFLDFDGRAGGGFMSEDDFQREVLSVVKDVKRDQHSFEARMESISAAMSGREANFRRAMAVRTISKIQTEEKLNLSFNLLFRQIFRSVEAISRAANVVEKRLNRALGTTTSPGSTVVQQGLIEEVYDALAIFGAWSTLDVIPVNRGSYKVPVKTARPTAGWIDEGSPIPDDTNQAGTAPTLLIKTAGVLVNVSKQLLEDAEIDLTQDLLLDFIEALAERLDWSFFRGTGTANSTDGGFTGIFSAGTAATAATGNQTVEDLDYTDFIRCLTTVKPAVLSRPARWWIHPTMLARVCAIKDIAGRPIFLPSSAVPSPGAIGSILGYPVSLSLIAPTTNTAGSSIAVFGDPKAYAVGIRQDIGIEAAEQFRWNTFEVSMRGIVRAGGVIRDAQSFAVLKTSA